MKPENILIGCDGEVKIADFGLARIVGEGSSGRITRSNARSAPAGPDPSRPTAPGAY